MPTNSDFTYPDILQHKPMVEDPLTPDDIIGPKADMVKKHIKIYARYDIEERRSAALESAGITYADREMIAEMYKALRDNGYRILGLDELGRIRLGIVTTSFPQKKEYTDEEIRKAKITFKTLANDTIRGFGSMSKVTEAEIEDERHRF